MIRVAAGQALGRARRSAAAVAVVLSLAAGFAAAAPGGAASEAGERDAPASGIRVSRSGPQAHADLEIGLPKAGGRLLLVSPRTYLRGLLLPLHRGGLLSEIVAVLPYEEGLPPGAADAVRSVLEREGVSAADRATFALDNGSVRGRIGGMPVLLCALPEIPELGERALAVVDAAFLPALYRNEVKTPMAELAWKLILTLRRRHVTPSAAVVLDAAGEPDFPLEFGYLPELLREMLSEPGAFAEGLPEKWKLLDAAAYAESFAQSAEAARLLEQYLDLAPGDASASYRLAMIAAREQDGERALRWLLKAATADSRYARAFAEAAGHFAGKGQFGPAEKILRDGAAAFPKDPTLATSLAKLYVLRGKMLRESGDPAGAAEYLAAAARVPGADPAVVEEARRLLAGGTGARP